MSMSVFASSQRFALFQKRGSDMRLNSGRGSNSTGKRSGVFSAQPKLSKLGGLYVNKRSGSSGG
jgi:hypothetical protein